MTCPPATPSWRIGVIGAGGIARAHLAATARAGLATTVYSPHSAARIAPEFGATAAPDLDALIAASDLVVIATPTDAHREAAVAAARAGLPVICEKPIERTFPRAEALAEACAAYGVALLPAHVVRFFPAYAAAQAQAAAGTFGAVTGLTLTRAVPAPTSGWFADRARSGGAAVDLMIHDADFARWVAGEVVRVAARRTTGPGGTERVTTELTHATGAVSTLTAAWTGPGTQFATTMKLRGTVGGLRHTSAVDHELEMVDAAGHVIDTTPVAATYRLAATHPEATPFDDQLAELTAAAMTGAPARVTTADGLAALAIVLAGEESIRTGAPVAPSLPAVPPAS